LPHRRNIKRQLPWGKATAPVEQGFTQGNAVGHVHAEDNDSRAANLRLADEGDSLPAEMSFPFLASWIEKTVPSKWDRYAYWMFSVREVGL
jgi:hypothetical protein